MNSKYEISNDRLNNFNTTSVSKKIFAYYILIIFAGTILLTTPLALQSYTKADGNAWTLIDSLFTASSAFSDTGLIVSPTATQFTKFGQTVILLLIQVGGIGFLTIKIMFWTLIGKKIGIKERMLLSSERGSAKLGGTLDLVKTAIFVIFALEVIGTFVLGGYFYFVPVEGTNLQGNIGESLWHGLFHSVSAINNAGFDITGTESLAPYFNHYFVQIFIMILFIVGGVGFPVIHDVKKWFKRKKLDADAQFKWSFFTKISMITYISVAVVGLALVFSIELSSGTFLYDSSFTLAERIWGVVFNTFSTRNAGFATMDLNELSTGSHLVYSLMMFIGSAPSSTAGGIRTTTLALCVLGVGMMASGKEKARAFGREIKQSTLVNALVVFFVSMGVCLFSTMLIMMMMPNTTFMSIWFEVASAFGTTGLSLGITSLLTPFSKMLLILIMFLGQLGVSSAMLVWVSSSRNDDHFSLPETDITIG